MTDSTDFLPEFTIITNAHVLAPEEQGIKNVLIAGNKIFRITTENIELPAHLDPVKKFDLEGNYLTPGFIDGHVHIIGGGGEGGPATRTPEITLSRLSKAGVTTVMGVLGTDGTTRSLNALLAKCQALREEGLSAWIYTGAYQVPTPTILESIRQDMALLEAVLGTKVAISDHRSSQPTHAQLRHVVSESRVGGMLGGKPGLVHMHVGSGENGLEPIFELLRKTEIPASQFYPTHVSRSKELLVQAAELTRKGGTVDVTAGTKAAQAVQFLWEQEAVPGRITLSSDANGSKPRFNTKGEFVGLGVGSPDTILSTVQDLNQAGVPISDALALVTENPARQMDLVGQKGEIITGYDADLLCLNKEDLTLRHVWAKGQTLVEEGEPKVLGTFE